MGSTAYGLGSVPRRFELLPPWQEVITKPLRLVERNYLSRTLTCARLCYVNLSSEYWASCFHKRRTSRLLLSLPQSFRIDSYGRVYCKDISSPYDPEDIRTPGVPQGLMNS